MFGRNTIIKLQRENMQLSVDNERLTRKLAKANATIDKMVSYAHQQRRTDKKAAENMHKVRNQGINDYTIEG